MSIVVHKDNSGGYVRIITELPRTNNPMMRAFVDGFNEVMQDISPNFDKYAEKIEATSYETGRTYAIQGLVEGKPKQLIADPLSIPSWVSDMYRENVSTRYGKQAA